MMMMVMMMMVMMTLLLFLLSPVGVTGVKGTFFFPNGMSTLKGSYGLRRPTSWSADP